ncbi:hypothetical protein [Candidatus Lokiarchaeum ossiferum]|uniref:hypothetical protein n=1 Tax=Candidatus Lokiarchaeum ossiferum TaxID=2951803 RepID=UPI00352D9F5A
MMKWLLSIGNLTWDGIIQAVATLIVVFLALFLDKIKKYIKEKEKIKELGYILKILITVPIQNTFMIENLYQKLSKFDENILQTLGLFLITDMESLGQFTYVNKHNPPKFPLLYCSSNVNYPCLIAYPNFQQWRSRSNLYALPGSLTAGGGSLADLFPLEAEKDRIKIWNSVKKQGKTYGFKLEQRKNFEEWKSYRRNRKQAKMNYFRICNIIRYILGRILLKDSLWTRKLHYYAHNTEFDRIKRDFLPINRLQTEKGVFDLHYYIFDQGDISSKLKTSALEIAGYRIFSDGVYNKNNLYNLRLARKKQLGITKNKNLDQMELDIIQKMGKVNPSKKNFQSIMNQWIKKVGYCRVPRRFKKILPINEKVLNNQNKFLHEIKEHLQFFINYRKVKFMWRRNAKKRIRKKKK